MCFSLHLLSRGQEGGSGRRACIPPVAAVLCRDQEVGVSRTHLERSEEPSLPKVGSEGGRVGPGGASVASNAKTRRETLRTSLVVH